MRFVENLLYFSAKGDDTLLFERKIYKELLAWKNETHGEKALLIEGARRIGKSTIAEEFAKNEYRSYLLIDFTIASEFVKNAFNNYLNDLDTFWMLIQSEYHKELFLRDSLVIFDEIQKFPKAREAIKYLVRDGRYDILETGSLISIHENVKDINIPSEERDIKMYPMDFEEFAEALGESQLLRYIRMCFEKHIPPDEHMHNKAGLLFREYMLVGGMPKAVSKYLESGKSFHAADVEKRDILVTYRNDIGKIASSYRTKVLSVFDQIPAFLSQHEKRVRLKSIEGGEGIDYEETFFWLSDSMIVNECFNSTDPNVGLSLNEDRTYIKCYLCDTGLLISHTFDESQLAEDNLYLKILKNRLSVNKGMFFENAVAQCLTAGGHKLYYYNHYNETLHRNDMEIDFLISEGSKISGKLNAIEVKSSKNYTTTSLSAFLNRYGRKRIKNAYVIHPKSYQEANGIIYLPAYMSFCL